jgi:hypothetical protein
MGIFSKVEDYKESYKEPKVEEETITIDIDHCHGERYSFMMHKKDEYRIIDVFNKLQSGSILSINVEDIDKTILILSSKYIQDSVITIQ